MRYSHAKVVGTEQVNRPNTTNGVLALAPLEPPTPPASTQGDEMPRTSIIDFQTRATQRFGNLAAETRLHARDGTEAARIDRLVQDVRTDRTPVTQAHAVMQAFRASQRDQQTRAA